MLRGGSPALVAAGTALALAPIAADRLGLGGGAGLGIGELCVVAMGALVAALGLAPSGSRARRALLRGLLLVISSGVSLLVADVAMLAILPKPYLPFEPQGMLAPDPELDYAMTPGWRSRFDDALGRGEIRLNSLGHRDDEPVAPRPGLTQLLLLGDSFTFGNRLDQSETIDAWLERLSNGRVDAYNTGVAGYSPPNILGMLRRTEWFRGEWTLYLFFQNDLMSGEQGLNQETVIDGWLVHTHKRDGTPYTEAELRENLARAWDVPEFSLRQFVAETLGLVRLRAALARALDREHRLTEVPLGAFSDEAVAQAVGTTAQMRDLAVARGQRFAVVVIPALEEVGGGAYLSYTQAYVDGVRAAGIDTIEYFAALEPADYIAGDGHLSSSGCEKTAKAILEALERR